MEMIKGYCKTNLDGYEMFVKGFAKVPEIGERVACYYRGNRTTLRVCQITHDFVNNEPYISVELSKR